MPGAALHSGAIPIWRDAELSNAEITDLCSQIIPSEQHEIGQTRGILPRLQAPSSFRCNVVRVQGDGICSCLVDSRPGHGRRTRPLEMWQRRKGGIAERNGHHGGARQREPEANRPRSGGDCQAANGIRGERQKHRVSDRLNGCRQSEQPQRTKHRDIDVK